MHIVFSVGKFSSELVCPFIYLLTHSFIFFILLFGCSFDSYSFFFSLSLFLQLFNSIDSLSLFYMVSIVLMIRKSATFVKEICSISWTRISEECSLARNITICTRQLNQEFRIRLYTDWIRIWIWIEKNTTLQKNRNKLAFLKD